MSERDEDDRISSLPDDVLHKILAFVESKDAVRTSVLSIRWKLVWTSLPFLNFNYISLIGKDLFSRLVSQFLGTRNQKCQVMTLSLQAEDVFSVRSLETIVKYAIEHSAEDISVRSLDCKWSLFSSSFLKKLTLAIDFDKPCLKFLDQWHLPILHSLHLEHYHPLQCYRKIPFECFNCMKSLINLTVVRVCLPLSLDIPSLEILILIESDLPERWNLPSLKTLQMTDLNLACNIGDFLSSLLSLENLKITSTIPILKDCIIAAPRLINLELNTKVMAAAFLTPHVLILSPDISNITIRGVFFMTFGVGELERVKINLHNCILDKNYIPTEMLKRFYTRLFPMLSGLGGAKILSIDFDTFEALSTVSNYLELIPSPFHKLNYVKLPQGCKESSVSATLRKYLLGSTPGAAIVTAMTQTPENHQAIFVSRTSQKVMLDEPLATPMKKPIDFQDTHKKVYFDTVDGRVKVENMLKNSVVDAARVRQAGSSVAGTCIDQASSSIGNTEIWEWQDHKAVLVSPTMIQDDPLATLTKRLIDYQDEDKEVCADTVEKRVNKSVLDASRARQAGGSVAGTGIKHISSEAVPVSTTFQTVMLEEPSATLTKELACSQNIHTKACVDTEGKRVQLEDMVENCTVDLDRVRQGGTPIAGTCNVLVSKGRNQHL